MDPLVYKACCDAVYEACDAAAARFVDALAGAAAPPGGARARIEAALREDAEGRRCAAAARLYRLADLAPFERVPSDVPAIRQRTFGAPVQFDRAPSDAAFRARLGRRLPHLAGFDLRHHGLCLAGGAVSSALMDVPQLGSSGLFPVGHESDASALAAVVALADHLHGQWGSSMRVYRTASQITFTRAALLAEPVVVVLRLYATPTEVLYDFDFGVALWDGDSVLMTSIGRVAFEQGAMVLNLAVHGAGYERRICLYFLRGYDLVLPDLDVRAVAEGRALLPRLGFNALWHATEAGSIALYADYLTPTGVPGQSKWTADPWGLTVRNIRAADRGPSQDADAFLDVGTPIAWARYSPGLDIAAIQPDFGDNSPFCEMANSVNKEGNKIDLNMIYTLFAWDAAGSVAAGALAAESWASFAPEFARLCRARRGLLAARTRIPFAFARGAAPTPRTPTPAEWYGAAYAAPGAAV